MILVQVGESFESCAKRELAEETGISSVTESQVLPFTSNDIMPADGLHFVTVFVSLTVAADSSAAFIENSHRDWRWIAIDQIPGPSFAPFQALLDSGVLGNKP
jgi:8-oxo-dGTP diphosphatase